MFPAGGCTSARLTGLVRPCFGRGRGFWSRLGLLPLCRAPFVLGPALFRRRGLRLRRRVRAGLCLGCVRFFRSVFLLRW